MGRYQNITIDLSPRIIKGILVRKSVCPCGHTQVEDSVPLGRQYDVDIKSVRWARLECGNCHKKTDVRLIDVWEPATATTHGLLYAPRWFFFDVLDLGDAYNGPPKSSQWEPVENNMVSSPVRPQGRGRVM